MECPACRALSFLGEWQTPKELQSVATATKACEVCKESISTAYLVQPKEKRVGESPHFCNIHLICTVIYHN